MHLNNVSDFISSELNKRYNVRKFRCKMICMYVNIFDAPRLNMPNSAAKFNV